MRVIASDDVQHLSTVSPYADPSCASPSTSSTCTTCRITTPTSRVTECAAGLAPRHGALCPAFLCHLPPLRSPRVAASRERGAGSVAGHGHCLAERRPQRSLPLRLGGSTPRIAPSYSSPTRSGYEWVYCERLLQRRNQLLLCRASACFIYFQVYASNHALFFPLSHPFCFWPILTLRQTPPCDPLWRARQLRPTPPKGYQGEGGGTSAHERGWRLFPFHVSLSKPFFRCLMRQSQAHRHVCRCRLSRLQRGHGGLHLACGCRLPHWLWQRSVERQTGPAPTNIPFDSTNVTNLELHLHDVLSMGSPIILFQEHAIPQERHSSFIKGLHGLGWDASLSPLSPTAVSKSAGAGILVRKPHVLLPAKPRTDRQASCTAAGRSLFSLVSLTDSLVLPSVSAYGMVNGHSDLNARSYTNDLLDAAATELNQWPPGPKVIAGDLNADADDLEVLQRLINEEGWTDVGAHASRWGGIDSQPTCFMAGASQPTRRDFILVDDHALPLLRSCCTHTLAAIPTHVPLRITLTVSSDLGHIHTHVKPPSIQTAMASLLDFAHAKEYADRPTNATARTKQLHNFITQHMETAFSDALCAHLASDLSMHHSDRYWRRWSGAVERGYQNGLNAFAQHVGYCKDGAPTHTKGPQCPDGPDDDRIPPRRGTFHLHGHGRRHITKISLASNTSPLPTHPRFQTPAFLTERRINKLYRNAQGIAQRLKILMRERVHRLEADQLRRDVRAAARSLAPHLPGHPRAPLIRSTIARLAGDDLMHAWRLIPAIQRVVNLLKEDHTAAVKHRRQTASEAFRARLQQPINYDCFHAWSTRRTRRPFFVLPDELLVLQGSRLVPLRTHLAKSIV